MHDAIGKIAKNSIWKHNNCEQGPKNLTHIDSEKTIWDGINHSGQRHYEQHGGGQKVRVNFDDNKKGHLSNKMVKSHRRIWKTLSYGRTAMKWKNNTQLTKYYK